MGLVNHKRLLSDFTEYGDDSVGTVESIWERIKKVGENVFYRVEYPKNPDGSDLEGKKKREKDKKFVEKEKSQKPLDRY